MATSSITETARVVGLLVVMLVILLTVVSTMTAVPTTDSGRSEAVNIEGGSGNIPTAGLLAISNVAGVQQSTGTGVRLDGTNSYEASEMPAINGSFEVAIYAELADNQSTATRAVMTYDSGDQLAIYHNGTSGLYEAWYYNTSTRNSYTAYVSAPSPTAPTILTVAHTGDALTIYRNATAGTSADTTVDNVAAVEGNVTNWTGTQDELRVFETPLSPANRQTLVSTPTRGLANTTDTRARVMFDALDRDTDSVPVYYNGGTVDLSTATLTDSTAGEDVTRSDWTRRLTTLAASDGGVLDGAPVAFVDYEQESSLINQFVSVLGLLVIIPLLVAAGKLMDMFGGGF